MKRSSPGPGYVATQTLPSAFAERLAARVGDDRGDGAHKDHEVEPQRPPIDVLEIHAHPAVEDGVAAPLDLSEAGDAGLHRQPASMPQVVAGDLDRQRR